MRRREFIAGLTGTMAWPVVARAQQPAMLVIGFFDNSSPDPSFLTAFTEGLGASGYADGRNVTIEYRWAEGHNERLASLVADLMRRQLAVIASANTPSVIAAKAATETIPIIFGVGVDPVEAGLVASLNRPGGNATGVAQLSIKLAAKRMELLHELVPTATSVALIVNPTSSLYTEAETIEAQGAARLLGMHLTVFNAPSLEDIDTAFAAVARRKIGAALVSADSLFVTQRNQIVALAARFAIPALYHRREFTVGGGLTSYGPSLIEAYRLIGAYTGRILKGEKPADLPVQQSARIEMVINLKTAEALGLTIPETLLATADEVIQ
jgi:putative ABC transport system substrate-binding protein